MACDSPALHGQATQLTRLAVAATGSGFIQPTIHTARDVKKCLRELAVVAVYPTSDAIHQILEVLSGDPLLGVNLEQEIEAP